MHTKGVQPKPQQTKKKGEKICNITFDENFHKVTIISYSSIILNNSFSLSEFQKHRNA